MAKKETVQLIGIWTLAAFIMVVFMYATDKGWPFFDRNTKVTSGPWALGEYKTCTVGGGGRHAVTMICDRINTTTRGFSVRFWGKMAASWDADSRLKEWQCQENVDNHPAFTCRHNAVTGEK
jgi:hypothetical protein